MRYTSRRFVRQDHAPRRNLRDAPYYGIYLLPRPLMLPSPLTFRVTLGEP
jgi:hypothetical protein